MKSTELLAFFQRGLIPGPHESEKEFLDRAEARPSLPIPEWETLAPQLFQQWGFSIDWVPILYSPKKLLPWEGAVCWIQKNGHPWIQLRPSLRTKNLWGNSRLDILLHEAVHAARESFNEPEFEEFLAYASSSSTWKRWMGPLFRRTWEFLFIAITVFAFPWFPWISSLLVTLFLGRFLYQHYLFHKVKKNLPFPILLCMTDQEIRDKTTFQKEFLQNKPLSPRLQLIKALKEKFNSL